MIKQECIGIPDMILLLMNFFVSKKIKAEIVLSPGGAYIYKIPYGPFFQIFQHYETVQNSHFFGIFVMSPKCPPAIFRYFATEWML